jgi:hypothetical protein
MDLSGSPPLRVLADDVYPTLGDKRLGSVLPSDIQALVKQLSLDLAPATVGVVHRILAGIFKAAVRDRRIVASPCEGTRLPKIHHRRIEPLALEAVEALTKAMPEKYRALVFTTARGDPIRRTAFSSAVWRPAVRRAGLSGVTMHSLRHFSASLLIRHGESVKTVQARLGHASAAETLDTYSHLWPDSDDRTRAAVDSVLGRVADSVRTDAAH